MWQLGNRINGKYEVRRILGGPGKSGMGIIYVCYDHESKEIKALKTLQDKYVNDPAAVDRFKREAETWVRLGKHRNIVQATIILEFDKIPYIFLEYIPGYQKYGADLAGWIHTGRLQRQGDINVSLILNLAIQFCHGMIHAQKKFEEMGRVFVHRDIKPSNILVTESGEIKVTDFGLVKTLIDSSHDSPPVISKDGFGTIGVSKSGRIVGTLPYMSPEQCIGDVNLDYRSDIYSFGCVLHEMVTRKFIFNVSAPNEFLYHHLKTAPNPTNVNRDLDNVIVRCLQKDPATRYQSFEELANHLSEIYSHMTGKKVEPPAEMTLDGIELGHKGISLAVLGFPQEAALCFEQLLEAVPSATFVHCSLGRAYEAQGKFEAATIEFKKAIEGDSTDAEAHFFLGSVYLKQEKSNESITEFQVALSISPNDAATHINLGIAYFNLQKLDMAEAEYKEALRIEPNSEKAHYNLGKAYLIHNDKDKAVTEFNEALRIDPNDAATHSALGFTYLIQGNYDYSIREYHESLSIDPSVASTHAFLGNAYLESGNLDEAIAESKQALRIDQNTAEAYYSLGRAYHLQGEFSEALKHYQQYVLFDPEGLFAEPVRKAILELRQYFGYS